MHAREGSAYSGTQRALDDSNVVLSSVTTDTRLTMDIAQLGFVALGAGAGYAWHRLVGCRSGACPITANPYVSTLYGAAMGFLFGG